MITPGISLTLFKGIYDNKTNKRVDLHDFNAFERVLYQLAEKPRAGKQDAELSHQPFINQIQLVRMTML